MILMAAVFLVWWRCLWCVSTPCTSPVSVIPTHKRVVPSCAWSVLVSRSAVLVSILRACASCAGGGGALGCGGSRHRGSCAELCAANHRTAEHDGTCVLPCASLVSHSIVKSVDLLARPSGWLSGHYESSHRRTRYPHAVDETCPNRAVTCWSFVAARTYVGARMPLFSHLRAFGAGRC